MSILKSQICITAILTLAVLASMSLPGRAIDGKTYGVYQYVVQKAEGSIDEISAAIGEAAVNSGWTVSGTTDSGDPNNCDFKSRVIVLYHPQYADEIVGANTETGPYAALDRVNIFQDEEGTHVSVVNPNSINRTILMEDTKYQDVSDKHLQELRAMILSAVKGTESSAQYGEFRTEGKIGKTMGVVAGGDFKKLVHQKYKVKKGTVSAAGQAIGLGFQEKSKTWGLKLVYKVYMPAHNVYVLGVSGSPMDTKSFQIVKGGQNEQRKEFACPGLSHAGAYPIEIVVYTDGSGQIRVAMIDMMYRMKMYFEDAGTTSFMKNMKMPGSIEKEITRHIKKGFEK
jgi:uncharacterized protein (DUF302 family)